MKGLLIAIILLAALTTGAQKNPNGLKVDWKTDTTKTSVPLKEFLALMKPDGIPPIDKPIFWKKSTADTVFFKHEPVIVLEQGGEAKAYPLSILMYHEIVNDHIGREQLPITVTYCPLCNASIAYSGLLPGESGGLTAVMHQLDFGVSGMLRKSDMVMYDRKTESWWQQFTGECLVGEFQGRFLNMLPSQVISYSEFYEQYPGGLILSTITEHNFTYGENPYVRYDSLHKQPRLFFGDVDKRLPPMERVIDVESKGKYKIYPLSKVMEEWVINDQFNGLDLVIFHQKGVNSVLDNNDISKGRDVGATTVLSPYIKKKKLTFKYTKKGIRDEETGSIWSVTGRCTYGKHEGQQLKTIRHANHFAFAWFAFRPDCEIYGQ